MLGTWRSQPPDVSGKNLPDAFSSQRLAWSKCALLGRMSSKVVAVKWHKSAVGTNGGQCGTICMERYGGG